MAGLYLGANLQFGGLEPPKPMAGYVPGTICFHHPLKRHDIIVRCPSKGSEILPVLALRKYRMVDKNPATNI